MYGSIQNDYIESLTDKKGLVVFGQTHSIRYKYHHFVYKIFTMAATSLSINNEALLI